MPTLFRKKLGLNSLEANKTSLPKCSFCRHYKKKDHIESRCFAKYPELRANSKSKDSKNKDKTNGKATATSTTSTRSSKLTLVIMPAFTDSDQLNHLNSSNDDCLNLSTALNKNKLVLDLGATEHHKPNKDWLVNC